MKAKELREKDIASLEAELLSLGKARFGLRMQAVTGQLAKTSELRKVRRDIARIKTVLSEKRKQA